MALGAIDNTVPPLQGEGAELMQGHIEKRRFPDQRIMAGEAPLADEAGRFELASMGVAMTGLTVRRGSAGIKAAEFDRDVGCSGDRLAPAVLGVALLALNLVMRRGKSKSRHGVLRCRHPGSRAEERLVPDIMTFGTRLPGPDEAFAVWGTVTIGA